MSGLGVVKSLAVTMAVVVLGLATANPAFAQIRSEPPLTDGDGGLVLAAHGYELWLPAPDWLDGEEQQSGTIRPQIDATFRAGETTALLEIYPKGESEALWSTLYGARISTGSAFGLKEYRAVIMS